jgi:hypothetical protein
MPAQQMGVQKMTCLTFSPGYTGYGGYTSLSTLCGVRGAGGLPEGGSQTHLVKTSQIYVTYVTPVTNPNFLICVLGFYSKADLFVGNAGFKITVTGIPSQLETGLRALSTPLGITFDICWSLLCHRATYLKLFMICSFEAFSILERQDHG